MEHTMENILSRNNPGISTIPTTRSTERQFILDVIAENAEENNAIDTLTDFIRQTWNVFGVSILFNFHRDETHLKQYTKRLREEVANTLTQEDVTYSTYLYIMEDLILPTPLDPPPVKIEVYAKKFTEEETIKKCIYTGILLSWNTTQKELSINNSLRLPLLLCRGTKSCMKIIHNALSCMFDCMIIALPAQEDDLMWLVPIIITPTNKEEDSKTIGEIRMAYNIPDSPDTDSIVIKFKIVDLIKILTVLLKDQTDTAEISFTLEHIEKFREIIDLQMMKASALQLRMCLLHKISLPTCTIMGNKMKVMKTDTMNRVLLYFNAKALDTFNALNYET